LQRHLFTRIIVFQVIEYSTGKPSADTLLGPEFALTSLKNYRILKILLSVSPK